MNYVAEILNDSSITLEGLTLPKALELLSDSLNKVKTDYYDALTACQPEKAKQFFDDWVEIDQQMRTCQRLITCFVDYCDK